MSKINYLFLFYLLDELERIMSKGTFLKSQRNHNLQFRLLNPLVLIADAVDVVTTNEKEKQEND